MNKLLIKRHLALLCELCELHAYLQIELRSNGSRHGILMINGCPSRQRPIGENTLDKWHDLGWIKPSDPWFRKKYYITEKGRELVASIMTQPQKHSAPRLGYPGVRKYWSKYVSEVKIAGRTKYVGTFDTPEEAYKARCEAAHEAHGRAGR